LARANDSVVLHPLSDVANNWTHGTHSVHTTPPSATQVLHPVACKLLLIVLTHGGMGVWVYLGGWLHTEMSMWIFWKLFMQDSKIISL